MLITQVRVNTVLPVTFPATHIKLCVQCRITSTYVYSPTRVFRSVPLLLFAGFLILGLKMSDRLKVRSVFFNFILNYTHSQLSVEILNNNIFISQITVEIPRSEEENLKTFLEQCGGKTCEGMFS